MCHSVTQHSVIFQGKTKLIVAVLHLIYHLHHPHKSLEIIETVSMEPHEANSTDF